MVFFLEIVPEICSGTIYGIHDINLPFDYDRNFTERLYSEQYMLGSYILGGADGDKIELPTHYLTVTGEFGAAFIDGVPVPSRNGESFWLRRGTSAR
jgi:hypothetical protein